MSNIAERNEAVRAERDRAKRALGRLEAVLRGMRKLAATESARTRVRAKRPRQKMSAAARRKIAAAQKARWAKIRKQGPSKQAIESCVSSLPVRRAR